MAPSGNSLTPVGSLWYKSILQTASCGNDTKPDGFSEGRDALNWAVVLPAGTGHGWRVRVTSAGSSLQVVSVSSGLNFGSPNGLKAGTQTLELLDPRGKVALSAKGGSDVSDGCPDGVYNMNPVVVELGDI
jgi:glucan endo-1,3-alpha-glucosidase